MSLFLLFIAICISCVLRTSSGFVPATSSQIERHPHSRSRVIIKKPSTERNRCHATFMSIFDGVGKFFSGLNNNKDDVNPDEPNFEVSDSEDVDGVYTGSKRIITIPGESRDVTFNLDIR